MMRNRELLCAVVYVLVLVFSYGACALEDANELVLEGLSAEYHLDDDTGETSVVITNSLMTVPPDWSLDLPLVGGGFTLDWLDSNDVNYPVEDFIVYASQDAGDLWSGEAVLMPGQSTIATFTPIPEAQQYVLTYTGEFEGQILTASHTRNALRTIADVPTDVSLLALFHDLVHGRNDVDEENVLNMRGILLTPRKQGAGIAWKASPTNKFDNGRQMSAFSSDGDIFVWAKADKLDRDFMFHSGYEADQDYLPQWIANQCGVEISSYDGDGGGCVIQECDVNTWDSDANSYCPGDQVISAGWFTRWNKWDKVHERVYEEEVYEVYTCLVEHVPGDTNEPGVGEAWQDVWMVGYPDVSLSLTLEGVPADEQEQPGGELTSFSEILPLALLIQEGPYALPPTLGIAKLEVVGDPNVLQVWDNDTTVGTPVLDRETTSLEWDLSQGTWPTELYVQGVEPGTAQIIFSFNYAGQLFYAKVRVRV